ncbi:MAG: hypothetical protein ACRDSH_10625 [Pseudonocardiaceae bacterium]
MRPAIRPTAVRRWRGCWTPTPPPPHPWHLAAVAEEAQRHASVRRALREPTVTADVVVDELNRQAIPVIRFALEFCRRSTLGVAMSFSPERGC